MAEFRIVLPSPQRGIVDQNGVQTKTFRDWVGSVTDQGLIRGDVLPEGNVSARAGASYFHTGQPQGQRLYVKAYDFLEDETGRNTTKGWELV